MGGRVVTRWIRVLVLCLGLATGLATQAQTPSRNLAPGFTSLPKGTQLLVAPLDVELFSISGGGVWEPKADWTDVAQRHLKAALDGRARALGLSTVDMDPAKADDLAELLSLHGAMAGAIATHHNGALKLPTKEGKLDWSFGDALRPLQQATGQRYALFTWVRDSYASAERKAVMVGMALLGVGLVGGIQIGYASLVDLETGQVLWFNQLVRGSGDLRETQAANESVNVLLTGFPSKP
jgi:hypothetical protein